jgi:hypothetical protein
MKLWIAVVLEGVFASMLAHADPVTFKFTGTVAQVPIDDFNTGIQVLDPIAGSFTFDSAAVDAIAAPTSASYASNGAAFGMTVSIGPGAVMFLESGFLNIGILNSFVDQYTVHAVSTGLTLDLFFQDSSGTAFSSDGLPLGAPLLAAFVQREFHLDRTDIAGEETQVDGTITSLTCGSGCVASAVPEPSYRALVFIGSILCAGWQLTRGRISQNRRKK